MPRAFDRRQLGIDRDPLRSLLPEVSKLPSLDIPDIFAVCNQPFITGMKLLGTGDGEVAKIATGLQAVIDTLFGTLFCNAQTGLSPQTMFGALGDLLEPIINSPFVQGLVELADWLGRATGTFLGDVFQGLIALVDWVCGILTCNPNASGTTPQTLIDGFQAVLDPIVSNPFIQGIIAWADEVGVAVGNFALDLYNGILAMVEALCSLVTTGALPTTYGNWSNTPLQIVTDLAALAQTLLDNPLIDGLRDLIAGTGNLLYDTISGLSEFVGSIFGILGGGLTPQEIVDFLQNTINTIWELISGGIAGTAKTVQDILEAFSEWVTRIPLIGPLVGYLTAGIQGVDFTPDFAGLAQWADRLLHTGSNIPAGNLFGQLSEAVFGTIPVSHINIATPNLLTQGSFGDASNIAAADGWSWSSTENRPGSTGGTAAVACNGSLRQLYSNQVVKVTAGDRINLSAYIKTSANFVGSNTSIVLSLIPFIGTTAQQAVEFASRGASSSWLTQPMTGSANSNPVTSPWTVPANVTSVRVRLAVTAAATAGTVYWDDISLTKTGTLQQTLVESLIAAWNEIWRGLTNPLLPFVSGKTWEDLFGAASGFRSAFNTEEDRGGTLRFNLFGNRNTVGTQISEAAVPQLGQGKVSGLPAALAARELAINTLQSTIAQGYQIDYPTNGSSWNRPSGLSELYVVCFGGGAKGSNGTVNTGGAGGVNGGYVAAQIDVDDVPASVPITIGGNTSASSTPTTFGNLLSSEAGYKGYVATPVGLIQTAGQPGSGGSGGSSSSSAGKAGQNTAIGSVGGAGGSGSSTTFPQPGGNGGNGINFGLSITGGAGGGGGSYSTNGPGANGGAGGFPGGGGGGGGGYQSVISNPTGAPGIGGNGGLGYMLVIYKVARTTT